MNQYKEIAIGPEVTSCVAYGYFDGMHKGHQAVIKKLSAYPDLQPIFLSFAENIEPVIYTEIEKEHILSQLSSAQFVSVSADEICSLSAEDFARSVLVEKFKAKAVILGENALTGSDKMNVKEFKSLGMKYNFAVETVPTVCHDGEAISSEMLKSAIQGGDFSKMQELLGHSYLLHGVIVHGKAAGRKFGMPTANLGVAENKLLPPHGVYGSNSLIEGEVFRGMTNIGLRPSDDDIPIPSIETFILNFNRDIYDKEEFLELLVYIRGVRKFPNGLAEVRQQINKDIEQVKEYMRQQKLKD